EQPLGFVLAQRRKVDASYFRERRQQRDGEGSLAHADGARQLSQRGGQRWPATSVVAGRLERNAEFSRRRAAEARVNRDEFGRGQGDARPSAPGAARGSIGAHYHSLHCTVEVAPERMTSATRRVGRACGPTRAVRVISNSFAVTVVLPAIC